MSLSAKKTSHLSAAAYLFSASQKLEAAGISTARLDVLVLMEDVLNTNRTHILAYPDLLIRPSQQKRLDKLLARRALHEPLAYIRNKTEFYGRSFYINKHVLEPRSESEAMIELLKTLPMHPKQTIVDVGTGSGALAITAKLELPAASVIGLDIDSSCLMVARENAEDLGATVVFMKSNLLEAAADNELQDSILLCNLPYVPDDFHINPAASHEPRSAIFGGPDGLDLYRALFRSIRARHAKPTHVLTEALPPQHHVLKQIAASNGYVFEASEDFIQLFRMGVESQAL